MPSPEVTARLETLLRALRWYAWPDRYVPRFEGVGRAGLGVKYRSNVESDLGRLARQALGSDMNEPGDKIDRLKEAEGHAEVSQAILKKIREGMIDDPPKTASDWGILLIWTLPAPILRALMAFLSDPEAVTALRETIERRMKHPF